MLLGWVVGSLSCDSDFAKAQEGIFPDVMLWTFCVCCLQTP